MSYQDLISFKSQFTIQIATPESQWHSWFFLTRDDFRDGLVNQPHSIMASYLFDPCATISAPSLFHTTFSNGGSASTGHDRVTSKPWICRHWAAWIQRQRDLQTHRQQQNCGSCQCCFSCWEKVWESKVGAESG